MIDAPHVAPPSSRCSPLKHSIIETIGGTPLVELHRLARRLRLAGRLLAKLEYFNPGLSKKDRIALEIVRQARADGRLAEGQTVVELTSGNTGSRLAIVCRALGHPFVAVMSRGNSVERARMMQALGAEVVLVDQAPYSPANKVSREDPELVEVRARQLAGEEGIFGGFSSGAHLAAALSLLAGREAGATGAFLVCNTGLKYLSTDLYPPG